MTLPSEFNSYGTRVLVVSLLVALVGIAVFKSSDHSTPPLAPATTVDDDAVSIPITATKQTSSITTTKICLVTPVHNNAHQLPWLLSSVKDHITGLVVCDAGSVDGSVATVQHFLQSTGISGAILNQQPSSDSTQAHTLCLEGAQKWSKEQQRPCEYWLLADADEQLVTTQSGLRLVDTPLTAQAYTLQEGTSSMHHWRLRLVSTALEWEYGPEGQGVRRTQHGSITSRTGVGSRLLPGVQIVQHHNRSTSRQDLAHRLEELLRSEDAKSQIYYMLGLIYQDMKEYNKAIEAYLAFLEAEDTAQDDKWLAAYQLAELANTLRLASVPLPPPLKDHIRPWYKGRVRDDPGVVDVINAYMQSMKLNPLQPEPYVRIAKLFGTALGNSQLCYYYATQGAQIENAKTQFGRVYSELLDQICTSAWYTQKYKEGLESCSELLDFIKSAGPRLGLLKDMELNISRVETKLDFYVQHLGEMPEGYMSPELKAAALEAVSGVASTAEQGRWKTKLQQGIDRIREHYQLQASAELANTNIYNSNFRGILIPAGGKLPLLNAFINMYLLRHTLGCRLPIVLTYWGLEESDVIDASSQELIKTHISDVSFLDLSTVPVPAHIQPGGALFPPESPGCWVGWKTKCYNGWIVKAFTIYASPFKETLFLDSDSMPLLDPTSLFDTPQYKQHGNLFFPDYACTSTKLYDHLDGQLHSPWGEGNKVRQAESGQFVLDVERHRDALDYFLLLNIHAKLVYSLSWGDKDLFRVAFDLARKHDVYQQVDVGLSVPLVPRPPREAGGPIMYEPRGYIQHHPNGSMMFLHRISTSKYYIDKRDNRTFSHILMSPSCGWSYTKYMYLGTPMWVGPDHTRSLNSTEVRLVEAGDCDYDFMDIQTSMSKCRVEYDFYGGGAMDPPLVFEVAQRHHIARMQEASDDVYWRLVRIGDALW